VGQGRPAHSIYGKTGFVARILLNIVKDLHGDEQLEFIGALGAVYEVCLAAMPDDLLMKAMRKRTRAIASQIIMAPPKR
jgi:hypothetical protein